VISLWHRVDEESTSQSYAFFIVPMKADDWHSVRSIYLEGIATGDATFETTAPDWDGWDRSHLTLAGSLPVPMRLSWVGRPEWRIRSMRLRRRGRSQCLRSRGSSWLRNRQKAA
jgi:hypothetical protein